MIEMLVGCGAADFWPSTVSQMEAPIFGAMHSWVVDMGDSLTIDVLFDEIEHYMGIHLRVTV